MATTVSLKPNAVEISGSTSGTTTLQATAVAGTTTLTLPAATDTLVGKATTDTLTNKTLTGAAMNGTVGATTPSTGVFTTLSATGNVTLGDASTDTLNVGNGGLIKDASGNLGLGVTPTAWSAGGKIIELGFKGNILYGVSYTAVGFSNNAYYDATAPSGWKFANPTSSRAGYYEQSQGTHAWATSTAAGTAGNTATFTQVMTLDASGNLLVGTTTLSNRLSVVAPSGQYVARFGLNGTGSQSFINFVIGEDTTPTGVGSITYNGTATLYNSTSDQRLKENIVDAPEFGSVIDSIKVRSYDWKSDGSHQRAGFVAQELVTVAPEAVHQPADAEEMMAVDYSKLVPMLVKEIQSLRKRLAALESA